MRRRANLCCAIRRDVRSHIHESLRQFAGIADHAHSKKFPLGVPDKERLRALWG